MKKTLTVLIAAGALLGAAGCSAAPPLSNEETCARIQSVGAGPTSNSDKTGMTRLANRIRPIEATASEELKAPLHTIIEFLDESAKPTPDTGKLEELQPQYTAAGQSLNEVCGAGGQ
ncbi:hypothetical protein QFZ79_002668 [Arthrobacter sp. V4I6]|uniref:hypothetical protein n=1 Tax=unclassified Arthrobacter TaxID=235627 RepID=UPI0027816456|nr:MULTISPECIES: hypothetical protein [unclassified Arthrobacter]MDQ0820376.1 hypothetical protein [Arthrobacter sp. V1I7]MDQ0854557.1 hypothetical protein [Arthrobacter sp. V4I6]